VVAKDLVKGMAEQALQFGCEVRLDETVTGLQKIEDGGTGTFCWRPIGRSTRPARSSSPAGVGAFEARKLPAEGVEVWEGRGLDYKVLDPRSSRAARC
jgi:hypothetical protein